MLTRPQINQSHITMYWSVLIPLPSSGTYGRTGGGGLAARGGQASRRTWSRRLMPAGMEAARSSRSMHMDDAAG
jgi:hypothetical protein